VVQASSHTVWRLDELYRLALALETWRVVTAVVVFGLVRRVVLQPPYQRFMENHIIRYIPCSPSVRWESDVDPLVFDELPSVNERQPFFDGENL